MKRKKFSVWIKERWIGMSLILLIGIIVFVVTRQIAFGIATIILALLAIYGS